MDFWDDQLRQAVRALIPEVEGKPCVNTGVYDGGVYVCRRISGLHTDEDSFNGQCEWVDPEDDRPGELTDGMSISCDCVELGSGWWRDSYFGWYFIYDPALVARSLAGDHAWVPPFLEANERPRTERAPAPAQPRPSQRLSPKAGCPYLKTEEVITRLHRAFAFFAAHPRPSPDKLGATLTKLIKQQAPWPAIEAAAAGHDRTFSVVLSDAADTVDYLSFEVRPAEPILLGFRDEPHQASVRPLVERCARLLEYEVDVP